MAQNVINSGARTTFILFITIGVFHLASGNALGVSGKPVSIASVKLVDESSLPSEFSVANPKPGNSLFYIEVTGAGITEDFPLVLSLDQSYCEVNYNGNNQLRQVSLDRDGTRAIYEIDYQQPEQFKVTTVYFCLQRKSRLQHVWVNLGADYSVILYDRSSLSRTKRQDGKKVDSIPPGAAETDSLGPEVRIEGLRIESADKEPFFSEDNVPTLYANTNAVIRLFGDGLSSETVIRFTDVAADRGENCNELKTPEYQVYALGNITGLINVNFPPNPTMHFYICVKDRSDAGIFKHQGRDSWNMVDSYEKMLPLWLSICIIVFCLSASALFSGLNLGLMSMDRTELKILCNTGTETEQKYARAIQPVREHGNYLLCSILLANVFVNSIFTILLDDLTSGLIAVIFSTVAIVICGEISPQAVCSRHGLCVGAKTIYITKFTMILTFPLSYPISKFLDCLLGEEIGNVYNRERLKELVRITRDYNDLEKEEVNIISGALELRKKTVSDVMTRIEDVYMLSYDAILDFETVSEIMKSGFSRIPVFEGSRNNIVTMLYTKDLAFIDPDDNTPLKTLCQFYQNSCNFVFEDVTLDVMFKHFKEGHKGHMAFVHRVNNEGEGDPFYEVVGLVTLEDVIEELIQAEIMDETDVFTDNRSKRRRQANPKDFTVFAEKKENQRIHISPQLTLAMFQYLSTTVDPFKPDTISETILRRLLKQDIIYHIKIKNREKARNDPATVIYQQGKPVDYFVLILEGRVEVTVGRENMMFESGPFTYFGTQALTANIGVAAESPINASPQTLGSIQSVNLDSMLRHTFVPDYTVRAVTEVFYVRIKRSLYLAAKRASLLERSQKDPQPSQDQFDDEVEKLLHSLDEDDRSAPESPVLSRSNKEKERDKEKEKDSHQTPLHVAAPSSPLPVSASPVTNAKFISPKGGQIYNGEIKGSPRKIQEESGSQVPTSGTDLDAEIQARQLEARIISGLVAQEHEHEQEESTNLLPKQDRS
ncbi:unextended protein isoform X1 [Neodiprion lecontei]|uniref:Unextended protein isoform X1 n=1 Tax=Neodiprion lecontei TaxID=441921 RepID=A0A6J0BXF3_NEOLC|nr:unextended protein isoform X1 [Neodiprion lecontei]